MLKKKFLAITLLLGTFAHAESSLYSEKTSNLLEKKGMGMVYLNGKPVLKEERSCVLFRVDFETEATYREVLVILYAGKPIRYNDAGVAPRYYYPRGEDSAYTEAGVFYDPTNEIYTEDTGTKSFKYSSCFSTSNSPWAVSCQGNDQDFRSSLSVTNSLIELESSWVDSRTHKSISYKSTCRLNPFPSL